MTNILAKLNAGKAITADEWADASRKKEICGILGCVKPPSVRCERCGCWYCVQHIPIHFHTSKTEKIITGKESEQGHE